jgi:hypothetical protein
MKSSRWIIVCALAVFTVFMFTAWHGNGAEQDDNKSTATGSEPNPYEGKMLVIRMDRTLDERGAYLQKVHIQKIGGETFLVGEGFSLGPKWKNYEGRIIWVSIHHIEQMYQFNNVDDINKMYEKSDD